MTNRARSFIALLYGGIIGMPLLWMFARVAFGHDRAWSEAMLRSADQDLLANSLWLAIATTLLAMAIGVPLALLLEFRRFPGRAWIRRLYWIPLLIPPHIHAICWARVTGDRGWLTALLKTDLGFDLNIRAPLADPATSPLLGHIYLGPAWVMACAFFPLVTVTLAAGLRSLDPEGLEAARLGGSRWLALRRVVLPQVAPRLLAGALFVFVLALSTYPVVSLLNTPTLVPRIVFTFAQVDQGAGALLSLPLVAVAGVVVFLLALAERRTETLQSGHRPFVARRGGAGSLAGCLMLLGIASGIPLASLLWQAGPLRLFGGGADNYQTVFPRVADAFGGSLALTALALAALLVVSYPVGRILASHRSAMLEALSLALLAFPPVVVGVSLVLLWSEASRGTVPWSFLAAAAGLSALPALLACGSLRRRALGALACAAPVFGLGVLITATPLAAAVYERGPMLVVLAWLLLFLPFTVRVFKNGFLGLDRAEGDAARLAGHGVLSRTLRVELPRLGPTIAGAAIIAYVLCFTELAASLMTLRPGWQSVQVRIFNMVHYQAIGEVAALCVLVVGLAALPVVLAGIVLRRRWGVV